MNRSAFNARTEIEAIPDSDALLSGDYSNVSLPLIFHQADIGGSKLEDIIEIGCANPFLISEKFKNILEDNKLTGWKTYPISLYDKTGNEIKGYYGFSITGRTGRLEIDKSNRITKRYVPEGPEVVHFVGYKLDTKDWDRSDLSLAEGMRCILITDKVKGILEGGELKNINITNIKDMEMSESAINILEKQ